jgi:hypothetical protein
MVTKDFVFSMVRHILTFGTGWLVAKGFADAALAESIIGGVMAVIAVGWSYYTHRTAPKALPPSEG